MLLTLSAMFMLVTAVMHSVVGERRLILPLIRLNSGVMTVPLARQVLRGAWHLTSILMIACAVTVIWPATPHVVLAVMGIVWLGSGIFDAAYTRGKHIGWPFLAVAGALPLLYLWLGTGLRAG